MKNNKKLLSILFVAALTFTGCSFSNSSSADSSSPLTSENSNSIETSSSSSSIDLSSSSSNTSSSNNSSIASSLSEEVENPSINLPSTNVDWSQLTYSAVGDSITWGQDGMANTQMELPYVDVVGNTLGLKKVFNNGIGWSTMSELKSCSCHSNPYIHEPMCLRYNKISIYSDIISVSGGVNDIAKNVSLGDINSYDKTTFYGAYNTFIKGVKENYPSAWLFLITPTATKKTIDLDVVNDIGLSRADYYNAVIELGKNGIYRFVNCTTSKLLNKIFHKKVVTEYTQVNNV